MHKILCVEDAPEILELLDVMLSGYDVAKARTIADAKRLLRQERFSLILLDIELPDGTGFEILTELGDALRQTPVICITGKTDFASKVSAFTLGADDFIVKPFDPREVKLRIDSKLRKLAAQNDLESSIRVGPLTCQVQEQRLYRSGTRGAIELTSLEFRIFHLLARTQNKIFSRGEILDRVWGATISVTERAVDVHVSNLRKKLDGTGVTIEAIIGSEYRIQVDAAPRARREAPPSGPSSG